MGCSAGSAALHVTSHCDLCTRSEEHKLNSSHLVISYAVFCLKKKRSDRKSTRLNSSHLVISYAVFFLKKDTAGLPYGPYSGLLHQGKTATHLPCGPATSTEPPEFPDYPGEFSGSPTIRCFFFKMNGHTATFPLFPQAQLSE